MGVAGSADELAITPIMTAFSPVPWPLLSALLGLLVGALVTLVAHSLPERGRLLARPTCFRCAAQLGWSTISSTLRLFGVRRACPACANGPAGGDVWLEVGTAVVFTALAFRWPPGLTLAVHLAFAALLLTILMIDLRHREVYLILAYGGVLIALMLAPLTMSGGFSSAALGGAVGAAAFGLLYLLGRILYRGGEPLGTGDVTIAALLGVMAGFPGVLTALMIGIFAGGLAAGAMLLRSGSGRTFMPYGPALCLGGLLTIVLG